CAAMALTFGAHAAPGSARSLAIGAVVVLTAVNLGGVRKTASATRVLVAVVLVSLALVVLAGVDAGWSAGRVGEVDGGVRGVLQAAALLFFAFAGYARIATLGEEVRDPARTIPRAIPIALAIALAVYAAIAVVSLGAVGPEVLASTA